jgi:hypothetical protein
VTEDTGASSDAAMRLALGRELSGLLGHHDFAGAEQRIAGTFESLSSAIGDLCRALRKDDVTIPGWIDLYVSVAEMDKRMQAQSGKPCAAIALDLVNRESGLLPRSLVRTSQFQLVPRFYATLPPSDEPGTWAESTYGSWRGKHVFLEPDDPVGKPLPIDGLEAAVAVQHGDGKPNDPLANTLLDYFILLRVNQAVEREAESVGLPRSVPLVCGVDKVIRPMESGDCDFGPQIDVMHSVAPTCIDTTLIERHRRADRQRRWEAETEQLINELTQVRTDIQRLNSVVKESLRNVLYESCSQTIQTYTLAKGVRLPEPLTAAKTFDEQFDEVIREVRARRSAEWAKSVTAE